MAIRIKTHAAGRLPIAANPKIVKSDTLCGLVEQLRRQAYATRKLAESVYCNVFPEQEPSGESVSKATGNINLLGLMSETVDVIMSTQELLRQLNVAFGELSGINSNACDEGEEN